MYSIRLQLPCQCELSLLSLLKARAGCARLQLTALRAKVTESLENVSYNRGVSWVVADILSLRLEQTVRVTLRRS